MLRSKMSATSQEIEKLFGRPSSSAGTGMRISDAAKDGWFEVLDRSQKPYRWRALAKAAAPRPKPGMNTETARRAFGAVGSTVPSLWPSVWAYASHKPLAGIHYRAGVIHTLSDDEGEIEWVM